MNIYMRITSGQAGLGCLVPKASVPATHWGYRACPQTGIIADLGTRIESGIDGPVQTPTGIPGVQVQ